MKKFLKKLFYLGNQEETKELIIEHTFHGDKFVTRFKSHADIDKECGNRVLSVRLVFVMQSEVRTKFSGLSIMQSL